MNKKYVITGSVIIAGIICIFLINSRNDAPVAEITPTDPSPGKIEHKKPLSPSIQVTKTEEKSTQSQPKEIEETVLEETPEEKTEAILSQKMDPDDWSFEIWKLTQTMNKEQLERLLAMSFENGRDPNEVQAIQEAIMERWFQLDAPEAIFMVDQNTVLTTNGEAWLHRQLENLSKNDPQGAFIFVSQSDLNRISKDDAFFAVARGSAQLGNIDILNTALTMIEDPESRVMTAKRTAGYMQQFNPDQTDEWIATLPQKEQAYALAYSAKKQAETDVEAAMDKLEKIRNSPEMDAQTLFGTTSSILAQWGEKAPQEAAEWFMQEMKSGRFSQENSEKMMAMVLRVWVNGSDAADGAMQWLEAQIQAGNLNEEFLNAALQRY